jgi:hypothetical protein
MFVRALPVLSYLCQRVFITLQSSWQRLLDNLYRNLQEGCPINKQCNLLALLLRNLKVKIKIQEATGRFKLTEFRLLIKLYPLTVPDRRGWEQQVCLIIASNMTNVIINMCMCAGYLTVYGMVYFLAACVHVWSRNSQAKCPNWGIQVKQHQQEEIEGIY